MNRRAKYINVADALNSLAGIPDQIAADGTRIQVLEDKIQSLDENEAEKLGSVAESLAQGLAVEHSYQQVVLLGHQAVAGRVSRARLHPLPARLV